MPAAPAASSPSRGYLHCPTCRSTNVIPSGFSCRTLLGALGEVRIDHHGVHLDPSVPPCEGGADIAIEYRCLDGHRFRVRLRTTYATTSAFTQTLPCPERGQSGRR